jgi:O-antigen ligase
VTLLFIASVGPIGFYVLSGVHASRRLESGIRGLFANSWPLFFYVFWLAASVALLGGVTLPPEPVQSNYVPIFPMLALLVGIVLGALPGAGGALRWALALTILALGASILYDAFFPGTFSTIDSRPAGFAMNANAAALLSIAALVILVDYHKIRTVDLLMIIFVLISTILTLSRGGLLLCIVAMVIYFSYHSRQSSALQRILVLLMLGGSLFIVLSFAKTIVGETGLLEVGSVQGRLDMLLLKDSFYNADESRIGDFRTFLAMALQRPFLGYGPGFSIVDKAGLEQGPHNMYLRAWIDLGVFGLVAYLGLLGSGLCLFWRRRFAPGVALLLVVGVAGVLSHNIIDEKALLLLFGMALGMSVDSGGGIGRGE